MGHVLGKVAGGLSNREGLHGMVVEGSNIVRLVIVIPW
jgi:hypothetical protein